MKSANEVLASMKPDESLVDKYLSVIEKLVDEAAQNGKYSEGITLNFAEQAAVNANFLRKTIPEKLTNLGYVISKVHNFAELGFGVLDTILGMELTISWGETQSDNNNSNTKDSSFKRTAADREIELIWFT